MAGEETEAEAVEVEGPRFAHGRDAKVNHDVHIDASRVESFEMSGNGQLAINLYSGRNHVLRGEQARQVYAALTGATYVPAAVDPTARPAQG